MIQKSGLKRLALGTSAIVALTFTSVAAAQSYPVPHSGSYIPPTAHMVSTQSLALRGPFSGQSVSFGQPAPVQYAAPHGRPVQYAQPVRYPVQAPLSHPQMISHQQVVAPVPVAHTGWTSTHNHRPRGHKRNESKADIVRSLPDNLQGDVLRPSGLGSGPGFKISVDGHTVSGGGFDYESHQEHSDVALRDADVQVKFDGFDVTPRLNVGLLHNDASVFRGQQAEFHVYSNYWNFINRGEVRLFMPGQSFDSRPHMILPVIDGVAGFMPGHHLPESMSYTLRVFDAHGRFDETHPKSFYVTDLKKADSLAHHDPRATLNIYGEDHTLRRNIPVKGANVTVAGENVPYGFVPSVFYGPVPVDETGRFVSQQILPFGDRRVHVKIQNEFGQGVDIARDIHVKHTDFFYVGLGDLTLGQRQALGPVNLQAAEDEDWDDMVVNGRGAFYLKGKVRGDVLIAAAMDTGEERIKDLFNNLDEKDPRQLLRRLHADQYYPVYGDHSTLTQDAPTQGKFYIRVEKDDNHVMWGNFITDIQETEFTKHERGLYGGIVDLNSESTTSFGERKSELTAYAADPGTIPEVEVFRGTGGSVYFLQHQDISIGSERVQIEIVDKVTDIVKERRTLRPYDDYDVDYIQGRVVLTDPLQSTLNDGQIVRDGPLSGDKVYLVVRYEHTPGLEAVSGYSVGGRATQWLGDVVRLGASGKKDTTGIADQETYGADVLLRGGANTFVRGEYAESRGPGFEQTESTDGGFIFDEYVNTGASNMIAKAYRLETQVDLADLGARQEKIKGRLRGLVEKTDDGFFGTGRAGRGDIERYSAGADFEFNERLKIHATYDDVDSERRGERTSAYADARYALNRRLAVGVGVRHDERNNSDLLVNTPTVNSLIEGKRIDASAEVELRPMEDVKVRGFVQETLERDGTRVRNDRYGIGGDIQLTSRIKVSGEVSDGDGGLGANAHVALKKDDHSEIYLGYALDPDHPEQRFNGSGVDLRTHGVLTAGGRAELSDGLSFYGEERIGWGPEARSFTHAYGVNYKPDEHWSLTASVEAGQIEDEINGNFDRTAFAVSASHATDSLRIASNLEGRFEEGALQGQERDRTTWLMRNTIAYDAYEDVQVLGRLNFAISESDQDEFLDAEYIEGVAGIAYRPIENDWFNGLFKYTYYEDLSPAPQRSNLGRTALQRQKSQILSADTIMDVNEKLSLGVKYGYRMGEVELGRGSNDYVSSDAHLGIIRADYHVIKNWDIMAEGRIMKTDLVDETRLGALAGVYRHVGDNMKVGVGYSYSKFSDDLTNFDNDQKGVFLNVVGKI